MNWTKFFWINMWGCALFVAGLQIGVNKGREMELRDQGMQLQELQRQIDELQGDIDGEYQPESIDITIYAYAPVRRCTDSTPHQTASMQRTRPGIIAVSRDIERDLGLRFGDVVDISGLGTFEFQDRMNARHERAVDVLMPTVKACKKFGRQPGTLTIVSRAGKKIAMK